jgi:hypothetical protein
MTLAHPTLVLAKIMPGLRTYLLRAAMLASAIIAAAFASFTPALAQDWRHPPAVSAAPVAPLAPTIPQTALGAARALLEAAGGIKRLEERFPMMADQVQRLAQTDPVVKDAKFDVREMTLRLCKEHEAELITDVAKIYAAHLTIDEMRYVSAFYSSRTGVRFLQFSRALAENKDPDRRKAADEAGTAIGLTPLEKSQMSAQIKTPAMKKFVGAEPIISVEVLDAAVKWGNTIGKEITDAAIRERSSQSARA